MIERIQIFHTNDVHSHFGEWPKISRYLIDRRREAEVNGEACFVFDIGDHVDRSHPFTEATNGRGNIELLNEAQYDAVTIGNNEGITLSHEALDELYDEAAFDVVVANLKNGDDTPIDWRTDYVVYPLSSGVKVGVFGLTAPYPMAYRALGWSIESPLERAKDVLAELTKEADIIICLSHLGIRGDRRLAVQFPEINVILGGHTHHLLERGEWVGETLLAAAGKYGRYIGRVDIMYDHDKRLIVEQTASVRATASLRMTAKDIERAREYMQRGKEALQAPVFWSPAKVSSQLFQQSELASLFGRALIDYTEAECAMFNAGIFLGHLPKGCVTKGDIHSLLPHPINPVVAEVDGSVIYHLYAKSKDADFTHSIIRGLGFRGTYMGAILFERMFENDEGRLFIGNRPVLHGETYRLATLDMFTFGFFFPELEHVPKQYFMPELLRDMFETYAKKKFSQEGC